NDRLLFRGGQIPYRGRWQVNLESRTPADFAVDLHVPTALLDDPVDGGQTQPGPFARLLRGEKRLEDVRLRLRVHSTTGIGDGQEHVRARLYPPVPGRVVAIQLHRARFHREEAALRHPGPGIA